MGERSGLFGEIVPMVIMVVFLVAVIIAVWKTAKESKSRKYLAELMESAKSLYFCGLSLERIVKTKTLIRVQDWVDADMCRWWAPLAMLLLKDNPTATLYQGTLYDNDGTLKFHAWVEFNIWQGERYVLDFSWLDAGFWPKKRFLKWLNKNKVKLTEGWKLDHTTFWTLRWPNYLWELMQNQKTSHILDGLDVLCPENGDEWGFKTSISELETEEIDGFGVYTVPWKIRNSKKVISAGVIQDFVKYPRIKSPRDKTMKKAYRALREFEMAHDDDFELDE